MNHIKYLFEKSILNWRLARWALLLAEYDLKYSPLKAIKGRVVSDFFAEHTIQEEPIIDTTSLPDDEILNIQYEYWELYFGASNYRGCGVGLFLISPNDDQTLLSLKLDFAVINNTTEYEACLYGLQTTLIINIKNLKIYADS
ncbi:hypothetical protein vseg_008150 [Gypsophila vaccaria]